MNDDNYKGESFERFLQGMVTEAREIEQVEIEQVPDEYSNFIDQMTDHEADILLEEFRSNLNEGFLFRKRTSGTNPVRLNVSASRHGPKASLSLRSTNTKGLGINWNTRTKKTTIALRGTGLRWEFGGRKTGMSMKTIQKNAAKKRKNAVENALQDALFGKGGIALKLQNYEPNPWVIDEDAKFYKEKMDEVSNNNYDTKHVQAVFEAMKPIVKREYLKYAHKGFWSSHKGGRGFSTVVPKALWGHEDIDEWSKLKPAKQFKKAMKEVGYGKKDWSWQIQGEGRGAELWVGINTSVLFADDVEENLSESTKALLYSHCGYFCDEICKEVIDRAATAGISKELLKKVKNFKKEYAKHVKNNLSVPSGLPGKAKKIIFPPEVLDVMNNLNDTLNETVKGMSAEQSKEDKIRRNKYEKAEKKYEKSMVPVNKLKKQLDALGSEGGIFGGKDRKRKKLQTEISDKTRIANEYADEMSAHSKKNESFEQMLRGMVNEAREENRRK